MLASALAQHTSHMELIVAVHPGIITPGVAAKMGATLDNMTGGRCAINIVNGWWQEEMQTFGNGGWLEASDARYRRMDEFIDVMKGLWLQDSLTYEGEFYRVDGGRLVQKVVAMPHPRIYAASRSDRGKDVVARGCDCWFVDAPPGHRSYEENVAAITAQVRDMDRRCAALGRRVEYVLNAAVLCADDLTAAQARADALEAQARDNRLLMAGGVKGLGGGLVGPPDLIARRIARYRDIGIGALMLRFMPVFGGMAQFAGTVLPQFRG